MRILCSALAVLLLLLLPAGMNAQQASSEARVQAALEAAAEAGIPVALLESKIAEGRAKGVPMDRIAQAVETRLNALIRARDAMQRARLESTTAGDLAIAADAVEAGVSQSALIEIIRRAPQERRAVAVAVLANLVALGHASENALNQVTTAMSRGPKALLNLQARTSAELRAKGAVGVGAGGRAVDAGVRVDRGRRGRGGG
jgi:hypothetical protein